MIKPFAALSAAVFAATLLPSAAAQLPLGGATAAADVTLPAGLPTSYDVVSVKPHKADDGNMSFRFMPDGVVTNGGSLVNVIAIAYGVKIDEVIGVPKWAEDMSFDIQAKVTPEDAVAIGKLTREQRTAEMRVLLQSMLKDSFQLAAHMETRQLPIYELVVAKGGSKLKAADPANAYPTGIKGPDGKTGGGMMRMGPGMFDGQGVELVAMANVLSNQVQRTVVDKTGLTGKFDIDLKWTPDDMPPRMLNGAPDPNAPPPIFTAIEEQLGLKLQSSKGPVKVAVVDHLEQPREN